MCLGFRISLPGRLCSWNGAISRVLKGGSPPLVFMLFLSTNHFHPLLLSRHTAVLFRSPHSFPIFSASPRTHSDDILGPLSPLGEFKAFSIVVCVCVGGGNGTLNGLSLYACWKPAWKWVYQHRWRDGLDELFLKGRRNCYSSKNCSTFKKCAPNSQMGGQGGRAHAYGSFIVWGWSDHQNNIRSGHMSCHVYKL